MTDLEKIKAVANAERLNVAGVGDCNVRGTFMGATNLDGGSREVPGIAWNPYSLGHSQESFFEPEWTAPVGDQIRWIELVPDTDKKEVLCYPLVELAETATVID